MQSNLISFSKGQFILQIKIYHISAIADAKFAYSLSMYQYDNHKVIYLIGFLAQIYFDNGFMKEADSYCKLGFKMLDEEKLY